MPFVHPCNHPGCTEYALPGENRCEKHLAMRKKLEQDRRNNGRFAWVYKDHRWKKVRARAFRRDGWLCVECGSSEDLTGDHIIALAKGGEPFDLDNVQTLCRVCNSRKGDS